MSPKPHGPPAVVRDGPSNIFGGRLCLFGEKLFVLKSMVNDYLIWNYQQNKPFKLLRKKCIFLELRFVTNKYLSYVWHNYSIKHEEPREVLFP